MGFAWGGGDGGGRWKTVLAGAGTWRRYIQSCLEADGTLDVCLQKSRMLSFQFFFFFPSLSTPFRRGTLNSDFQPGHRGPVEGSVYLFIQRADGASGCYHNEKFNRPYLLPVREQESDADILQSLN